MAIITDKTIGEILGNKLIQIIGAFAAGSLSAESGYTLADIAMLLVNAVAGVFT